MQSPLSEIDSELEAFGKSSEEIVEIRSRFGSGGQPDLDVIDAELRALGAGEPAPISQRSPRPVLESGEQADAYADSVHETRADAGLLDLPTPVVNESIASMPSREDVDVLAFLTPPPPADLGYEEEVDIRVSEPPPLRESLTPSIDSLGSLPNERPSLPVPPVQRGTSKKEQPSRDALDAVFEDRELTTASGADGLRRPPNDERTSPGVEPLTNPSAEPYKLARKFEAVFSRPPEKEATPPPTPLGARVPPPRAPSEPVLAAPDTNELEADWNESTRLDGATFPPVEASSSDEFVALDEELDLLVEEEVMTHVEFDAAAAFARHKKAGPSQDDEEPDARTRLESPTFRPGEALPPGFEGSVPPPGTADEDKPGFFSKIFGGKKKK